MAKKIKLTEKQIKMLKKIHESESQKVLRITEQQFERLFPDKKKIEEGVTSIPELADFSEHVVKFLKEATRNNSDVKLDSFWGSIGVVKIRLIIWLNKFDIISIIPSEDNKMEYKVKKKGLISKLKNLYSDFENKYDPTTGQMNWENEEVAQEGMIGLGNDIEMIETTTAGGVGGSYEAPMGSQGPIKRGIYPHEELQEEEDVIDETTMSGAATGSYEQPQMWAKDNKNWRNGNDTMYPGGKIVNNTKFRSVDNLYAEVAKKTGRSINEVKRILQKK